MVLLFEEARIVAPYLKNKNGIGIIIYMTAVHKSLPALVAQ